MSDELKCAYCGGGQIENYPVHVVDGIPTHFYIRACAHYLLQRAKAAEARVAELEAELDLREEMDVEIDVILPRLSVETEPHKMFLTIKDTDTTSWLWGMPHSDSEEPASGDES